VLRLAIATVDEADTGTAGLTAFRRSLKRLAEQGGSRVALPAFDEELS
jgi:hypothetical protein